MEKSPVFIGVASPMNGHVGVGIAKGAEHPRKRRALAPGMSKHALYGQEQIIQTHVNKLITRLRSAACENEVLNMANWCRSGNALQVAAARLTQNLGRHICDFRRDW